MSFKTGSTLLERIAWDDVNERVRREQRNRERYAPAISGYRWWARRPHTLIGSILDAAAESNGDLVVSDPLSGGGTVAMEATRRAMAVYAQDLHPWATAGLAQILDGADPKELAAAGRAWLERLSVLRTELYGTICPDHGNAAELLTTFWVRVSACPECATRFHLYPYPLVSLASRHAEETHGYFGCVACGHITCSRLDASERRCTACKRRLGSANRSNFPGGEITCLKEGCGRCFRALEGAPAWRPVLVQRLCGKTAHLARPTAAEARLALRFSAHVPETLEQAIPEGVETKRLLRAGLERWRDLYPPRQLHSLVTAGRALEAIDAEPHIRDRLRLIVCGAAEMAGYASRWDRYYPKAIEALANHRFGLTGFSAETNLLATRGRGTFPRRLAASVRAAEWLAAHTPKSALSLGSRQRERVDPRDAGAPVVVRGSSSRQLLPDESIDLVLTDPPYFDDVQYAELGSLFLAWAQACGLAPRTLSLDLRAEAVGNQPRGADIARYHLLLSRIFKETARTLKPGGRMVLTYHNRDARAWWALARALAHGGFSVTALAVGHAENESDHAKRGRMAFACDLVIECRKRLEVEAPLVIGDDGDSQARELLAAGRAVAALGRARHAGGPVTFSRFSALYRRELDGATSRYIRLGAS